MNDLLNKPIERMLTYRSFLNTYEGISLNALNSLLNIPLNVLRNDFFILLSSLLFSLDICDTEDTPWDELSCDSLKKQFDMGTFDDKNFVVFDSSASLNADAITVPVDIDEYIAYFNMMEQKKLPKKVSDEQTFVTSTIRNKKYVHEFTPDTIEKLLSVEGAISDCYFIKILYKEPLLKTETLEVFPLKIGFDATENRYALIALCNNIIRVFDFDFIDQNIRLTIKGTAPKILKDIEKIASKVWGFEFDKCFDNSFNLKKPVTVSVRFFDEANVISKLKRDLFFRTPISFCKEESGSYLYVDSVFGTDSFINWVCSYGSSAQIISPQNLVDDFVAILKGRLN